MKLVAQAFDKEMLREVDEKDFCENIAKEKNYNFST